MKRFGQHLDFILSRILFALGLMKLLQNLVHFFEHFLQLPPDLLHLVDGAANRPARLSTMRRSVRLGMRVSVSVGFLGVNWFMLAVTALLLPFYWFASLLGTWAAPATFVA
ncbi:MAG TPA: hypothetical protein VFB72_00300 [Verrucomicrobiae bacterium]|nr:hypothetical protein [Verrucomicrobiae bacterium]